MTTATAPAPLEPRQGVSATKAMPAHLSVQVLTREAHKVQGAMGLHLSQNRLQRIVRRYLSEGRTDLDFRSWFLGYADPTGNAAVRNAMRAQR